MLPYTEMNQFDRLKSTSQCNCPPPRALKCHLAVGRGLCTLRSALCCSSASTRNRTLPSTDRIAASVHVKPTEVFCISVLQLCVFLPLHLYTMCTSTASSEHIKICILRPLVLTLCPLPPNPLAEWRCKTGFLVFAKAPGDPFRMPPLSEAIAGTTDGATALGSDFITVEGEFALADIARVRI